MNKSRIYRNDDLGTSSIHIICLPNSISHASWNLEPVVYDKVSAGCFGLDKHNAKKKENKTEEKTGCKWLNNDDLFSKENKGKEMTMLHPQRWLSSLIMFLLSSFMLKSDGSNHIVGDSSGWELYTNYTNWTQGREFHVGDVLVFNYNRDQHNVMQPT
ncbi:hypothetical protein HID58_043832 [Brassica napus]|uniref:Phytocyanin domain-containing protein n=1 Tax=Brassica napus TaxID=3708 RepID=A0ABQ8BHM1_BRANA|nr:hypothetical protein HID58_043832 [Brassica napus]